MHSVVRSLPIDRLFPFGRGPRGGGLISTRLRRARRPLGELTRISLRSIRATACYSLRDANLPPAPGEYARAGFNTTVFECRARDRLRSAG